jgi:hypothetical protein
MLQRCDRDEQALDSNGVGLPAPHPLRAARCRLNVMLLVLTTVILLAASVAG